MRDDEKSTPPPSYEDVTEMKNVVKVKAIDEKDVNSKENKSKNEKKKDEGEDNTEEPEIPPVGVIEVFKFATPLDAFLIIIGILISFIMGIAMPILCILFGDTLQVNSS